MSTSRTNTRNGKRRFLMLILPLVIVALGGAVAFRLMATKPTAKRAHAETKAPLVRVAPAAAMDRAASIEVMGTVAPARTITLRARVSGHVQAMADAFTPGGILRKGQAALTLDPADYRLSVLRAKSALENAHAALALELGQQRVAKAQLEMLAEAAGELEGDTSLALREPQLAQARATVADAEASLEQARLNLQRTAVRVPFNALVTNRSVNLGSQIGTTDTLGTLVGTDEYWVEIAVPLDLLRWFRFPDKDGEGSPATVTARSQDKPRPARVLRRAGSLVESSRMAKVIVAVSDPLGLEDDAAPLQLNEYVSVRVQGKTLTGVIPVPRSALREGDKVYIYKDGTLDIRTIVAAWSEDDTVYVSSGLTPGELVITNDIPGPVRGMALRVEGRDEALAAPAAEATHAG